MVRNGVHGEVTILDLAHGLLCKEPDIQRLKTNNPMVFGHCCIKSLMSYPGVCAALLRSDVNLTSTNTIVWLFMHSY